VGFVHRELSVAVPVKLFILFDFKSMVSITFLNPFLFFCILSVDSSWAACSHSRSALEKTI